jgi:hypothetical protein
MAIVVLVLAVVFCAMGVASILLYQTYSPEHFVMQLNNALAHGDTDTLADLVVGEDIAVSEEGLLALCRAFAQEDARNALSAQIMALAADAKAQKTYPVLSVHASPVFLGYSTYQLQVHSAQLLLTSTAQNKLLMLGDTLPTGETTAQGVLYRNLFPGSYVCTVTGTSSIGQTVTGEATTLALFSSDPPTSFDGALPLADITVSGCVSDEAQICIDGVDAGIRPVNGVVSLPQVAVGSTVTLSYTAPYGAVTTASVVFGDAANTALAFENAVTEGGVPAAEDVDTLLRIYFTSYFDAVNNQDIELLSGCTASWREQLASELGSDTNKASVFTFTDVACAPASLTGCTVGELPGFVCNATVTYNSTDRKTHTETSATDTLSLEFVFDENAWRINRVAACSADDYATNVVPAFA